MDDQALLRYSRHIFLPEIDIDGQEKLCAARILIIGVGGLGSSCIYYLAASGIGQLVLYDGDRVEMSNLQRQIVHTPERIGHNKACSAYTQLHAFNPETRIEVHPKNITAQDLRENVPACDVVIDCSDNFNTRYLVNAACVQYQKPLVSGAAVRFSGQLSVFDFREFATSGCYHCLFPQADHYAEQDLDEMRCINAGVFAPLVGQIGTMQAGEALKLILGIPSPLKENLFVLDGLTMQSRLVKRQRDPDCPVCRSLSHL